MVMLHTDLWMLGVPGPGADSSFAKVKRNEALNWTASIGIGINHPPPAINHAAGYYNSWGQQALQLQTTTMPSLLTKAAHIPPALLQQNYDTLLSLIHAERTLRRKMDHKIAELEETLLETR